MLSDRVELSSAEARVEQITGGSVGVFELTHMVPQTPPQEAPRGTPQPLRGGRL